MHNYIKCKKNLGISDDITRKLDIVWEDTVFLIDMFDNVTEIEKVSEDAAGESGVIWGGTGYCRIKSASWESLEYTGDIVTKASILGKDTDANISVKFEVKGGMVTSHDVDINLIDNTSRIEHDSKIKQCAIVRAKKMSTRRYRYFDIFIRKPLRSVVRAVGWVGSFLQDISWKIERQLNKL